jgi:hypothetical protein
MSRSWDILKDFDIRVSISSNWPVRHSAERRVSPFSAGLENTLRLLKTEFGMIDVHDIIIQLDLVDTRIRKDGLPMANARTYFPGVILSFNCLYGRKSIYSDLYLTWHDNLRAIGHHMYHLRAATKDGVGADGRMYAGWPSLDSAASRYGVLGEFAVILINAAGVDCEYTPEQILSSSDALSKLWRRVVVKSHPDTKSGDGHEEFLVLQNAKDTIKKANGW